MIRTTIIRHKGRVLCYFWNFFPLLFLFTASSSVFAQGTPEKPDYSCEKCNLIILNIDFLRSDYIGLISGSRFTPNIDEFFSNSIIFENAYSTSGSSYRGGLSILTSSNPNIYDLDVRSFERLGAKNSLGKWKGIYTYHKTIAEVLRAAKYRTINLNKGRRSGRGTFLERGFDVYRQYNIRTLIEDLVEDFTTELTTADSPFFALLHAVPTRLHRAFYPADRNQLKDPDINYRPYERNGELYGYAVSRNWGTTHKLQRRAEHLIYQQQLIYADEVLGHFFRALEEYQNDTIIVLYSGHGTQIGDKNIYASNGVSYESNIRVPVLINHPKIGLPIRIESRISLLDLVPTLYDMLNIKQLPPNAGESLVPLFNGKDYHRDLIYGRNDPDEFILFDGWKLIVKDKTERELYNLSVDPNLTENVYEKEKYTARLLEYVPEFARDNPLTDDEEWKLIVNPRFEYELYNLDDDPHEIQNKLESEPEVFLYLLNKLSEIKTRSSEEIADIVTIQ